MGLKIIVPVKRVVDYNVPVRVRPDGSGIDLDAAKMAMNPFDEIAVEAAVQLKEQGLADEVITMSVGPAKAEETLRTALAMGADRAILVAADHPVEPLAVAKLLREIVKAECADLVLLGKQAIDDDAGQTGQMLAALLGWGQATFASRIDIEGNIATVTREIEAGLQTLAVSLPAVITADLRLNTPRYASLANVMKARKKPLARKTPADYGVDITPRLETLATEPPAPRATGIRLENVDDLIARLRAEPDLLRGEG